jgi:hypothetical protein
VAAESVQGLNIFQQGRGVNDFAVYPNQILKNTKPVSTTTFLDLNFQFDFEQKTITKCNHSGAVLRK